MLTKALLRGKLAKTGLVLLVLNELRGLIVVAAVGPGLISHALALLP